MKRLSEALASLLAALDRLEIPYEIGGSAASSAHGIPRTTMALDIVVDLPIEKVDPFVDEVRGEFYADAGQVRDAFASGRAANLIHLKGVWKFDLSHSERTNSAGSNLGGGHFGKSSRTAVLQSNALSRRWRIRCFGSFNGSVPAVKFLNASGVM